MSEVSLIIFTCEGKEHLLPSTLKSFKESCKFKFAKTILAIDGKIAKEVIDLVSPDLIVQNHFRKGYIYSILNALKLIDTEYFFWLEDDFYFPKELNLDFINLNLQVNQKWSGIFFCRYPQLLQEEKELHFYDDFYRPSFGFSVSPTFCRTNIIKEAFDNLIQFPKGESTKFLGFEPFISNYFLENGYDFAILDPVGNNPSVSHIGQLETTPREYHMINSLDSNLTDIGKEYISGNTFQNKITLRNKFSIIPKLLFGILLILPRVFKSREAYDICIRTYFLIVKFISKK